MIEIEKIIVTIMEVVAVFVVVVMGVVAVVTVVKVDVTIDFISFLVYFREFYNKNYYTTHFYPKPLQESYRLFAFF